MQILAIGNSFSTDAMTYLHRIARADGVEVKTTNLYIGGCSLERHFRNMLSGRADYELQTNGQATGFHVSLDQALLNRQWDVITLQQASALSPDPDSYRPYAAALADHIRRYAPKARLVVHQTWAYEQGSAKLESAHYADPGVMFDDVERAYEQMAADIRADGIIPSGRLFRNMLAAGFASVHRDTFHASLGAGRYALGLLWYRMLTGSHVLENGFGDFDQPVTREEIAVIKTLVEAFDPIF